VFNIRQKVLFRCLFWGLAVNSLYQKTFFPFTKYWGHAFLLNVDGFLSKNIFSIFSFEVHFLCCLHIKSWEMTSVLNWNSRYKNNLMKWFLTNYNSLTGNSKLKERKTEENLYFLTRNNPRKTRFYFFIKPVYLDERQLPTEKRRKTNFLFSSPRPILIEWK